MWSVKHTGYQGVVKDSYQRVCVRLPAQEFLAADMCKKLEDLVSAYSLRHIFLEIDLKDATLDYRCLEEQCRALRDLTLPEEKLVFTCEVANYERDNTAIKDVMTHVKPMVILLKRCATRNKTLAMMKYLAIDTDDYAQADRQKEADENKSDNDGGGNEEHEEEIERPVEPKPVKPTIQPIALGASCLVDEERQYALDAQRGVIRAMCLGPVSFPDLRTCTIDLLHSRECNPYMTIDSFADGDIRGLGKFVKKYERPAPAILTKVLLELGCIVCVDRALIDHEAFYSDIMRLVHPFTHLQVARAPTDKFSFILPPEELQFLVDKSQRVELAEEDRLIAEQYTKMPAVRAMGV